METKNKINTRFLEDVVRGLSSNPKKLPSRYFYDETGDRLFQEIMKLPEYYLTGCEFEILDKYRPDLLKHFSEEGEKFHLIELGAGDGTKTRLLIEEFSRQQADFEYRPIDISGHVLELLQEDLQNDFPELEINPIQNDYFRALNKLEVPKGEKKVILFMGGNIGNFSREGALDFLRRVRQTMQAGDLMVIGFDLMKNPELILKAYNDASGVTRDFNLNLLNRINRELGADFKTENFMHFPTYDPVSGETKSYLVSRCRQTIHVSAADRSFEFGAWEPVHTEISQKYRLSDIDLLAESSGFKVKKNFFDEKEYLTVSLWEI